jgi:hypothetical protein
MVTLARGGPLAKRALMHESPRSCLARTPRSDLQWTVHHDAHEYWHSLCDRLVQNNLKSGVKQLECSRVDRLMSCRPPRHYLCCREEYADTNH